MDDEEESELSGEQLEKLLQYQEVTGVEDVSFARMQLVEQDWNVETAVQNHLSIQDSPQRSPRHTLRDRSRSFPDASSELREGLEPERRDVERRRPERLLGILPTRAVAGIFGWCYYLLTLPIKVIYSFIYRLILPQPRRIDPLGDILSFLRDYEAENGVQHPPFYRGSYTEALSHAKSELKFLLVYLHCKDNQDTPQFCREILSDARVMDYISGNVIFWGCSVTSGEGYRVSQALRENGYPFLAVIVLKDNKMTVVGRLEGPQRQPQALIQRLKDVIRDNEAYLVVARADRQEREINAALRLEQDAAYSESLRVDQEKARKRQEEMEAETRQKEEEREHEQSILEEKERRQRLKVEWVDRVPKEPEEGEEGVIHIVAKLPQGTRLNRRFYANESLSMLFYYIFCHPDSPDRFQVTTNFPRKFVPCEAPVDGQPLAPTFVDFGLPQRSMLFVTDLDA